MNIAMPIWKVEESLFSVWYFLTGKERQSLRKAIFIPYFIIQFVGCILINEILPRVVMLAISTIIAIFHWYSLDNRSTNGYKDSEQVTNKALSIYLDLATGLLYMNPEMFMKAFAFTSLSNALLVFDYFIMWADDMDKDNRIKRRESLPERLVKMFASFKPAAGEA